MKAIAPSPEVPENRFRESRKEPQRRTSSYGVYNTTSLNILCFWNGGQYYHYLNKDGDARAGARQVNMHDDANLPYNAKRM
ncbi:uncharacterized protein MYCFIDRAFT_178322 [Pseudocercospora fijiensis CIRAD86]|uniref:Uncharacterized protein n=1 Tax=Pseudocercospora fijiensis (strain CIRAD86) TaxID=383855 RepID=M3ARS6_PSEFD|nr:uncharacterized protein MYCFIDRAFT_178322 [Pseudocercospora fijiensis CIRAD86]EME79763.1 hypothetical protein MYCFIDRAFT_178322 [Pseudocercospora fijiensis CIRAD86]